MPYLPLSIWYGKNKFLAPDFPADSSQFFRVHGFTSAVRQMPTAMRNPFAWTNVSSGKKTPILRFGHTLEQNSSICPIISYLWMADLVMRFFSCGASHWRSSTRIRPKKRSSPLDFIFDTCASASSSHLFLVGEAEHMWLYPFCNFGALTQNSWMRPIMSYLWMIGLEMRLFFLWANLWRLSASIQSKKGPAPWILFLTPAPRPFRYVLVNSHLVHPPSISWLLALGILQTYPLSESFMIDFLMPYIHRLIDQPTLNHNKQKLISCHYTSGSFQEKKSGPFLVWYFIPGPISCPGTLTHCLLDFWKIVFFKKCTEPPEKKKKTVVQRGVFKSCGPKCKCIELPKFNQFGKHYIWDKHMYLYIYIHINIHNKPSPGHHHV